MNLSIAIDAARAGRTTSIRCPSHDDSNPSLSVLPPNEDGWVRIKCHAGCDRDQILAAAGLDWKRLMPPKVPVSPSKAEKRIACIYDYTNETGNVLFQVVRYEPKDFRQRRPDGNVGWIWNLNGVRKILFKLPDVLLAISQKRPIIITEGEKDALSLISKGWQATCNPMGAGKWEPGYTESLRDADVIVVPDNDSAGENHLAVVAKALTGNATRLRFLRLPQTVNGSKVKDASDFFTAGGTVDQFQALIDNAPDWTPADTKNEREATPTDQPFRLPKSDDDFSQAFLKACGDRLRFCPDLKTWLHFSPDEGWRRDETGQTYTTLLEFARQLVVSGLEAAKTLEDPQPFVNQLTRLKDRRRLDPALHLSTTDPRVVVRALDLDSRPEIIGCTNGILDVLTGKFIPFDQDVLVTRRLAVAFDPDAQAPTWERFLSDVQKDPIMRAFLQRLLGSALFGAIRDHILPFHHGTGANGKGTTLETVLDLFGGYGASLSNEFVYMTRNGASPQLELANLMGARLALGSENAKGGAFNEDLLKKITGGDRLKGRFLYSNPVEAAASYHVHLVGNHMPVISGTDDGIWRRFVLIPWPISIPPEQRDLLLRERIAKEKPGLLNWLLQGCIDWNKDGLQMPEFCRAITNDFRQESDELADFITEKLSKDPERYCLKGEVYTAYKRWAEEGGLRRMTKRQLSTALQERGFESGRTSTTRDHSWIGWTINQQ
jgi:putative DNA primase/helicase